MKTFLERISEENFDFLSFLSELKNFYEDEFILIVNYFENADVIIPYKQLQKLRDLKVKYDLAMNILKTKIDKEEVTLEHFQVQQIFNDFESLFGYMENIPKFLKTSNDNVYKTEKPVFEYTVKQNDTLETIAMYFYNDATQVPAILNENNLRYTDVNAVDWAGRKIKIPIQNATKDVAGVIDAPIGSLMLGKDIEKSFEFVDDDIKTLDGEETFEQSCNVMFNLSKGDIPEYPNYGHILRQLISSNMGFLVNSALVVEMKRLFNSDSTVKTFNVRSLNVTDDALFFDFHIRSINDYQFVKVKQNINL